MKKILKRILSIYFVFVLVIAPVLAADFDYTKYDFSDEAQIQFDNQQLYNVNSNQTYDKNKYENLTFPSQVKETPTVDELEALTEQQLKKLPQRQTPLFEPIDDFYTEGSIGNPYLEEKALSGAVVFVPTGTTFDVKFESAISSGSLEEGDSLVTVLPTDFIYNGKVVAPTGSMVYGSVLDAKSAGYAYGNGDIELSFNKILPPNGSPINISTQKIIVKAKSSRAKRMTRDVAVGIGVGIVGGLLSYLLTGAQSSEDFVRAIAVGGGLGGASGGIRGAVQKGEDVRIPEGSVIKLKLTNPINVSPYY